MNILNSLVTRLNMNGCMVGGCYVRVVKYHFTIKSIFSVFNLSRIIRIEEMEGHCCVSRYFSWSLIQFN
jgi:hypothetical protein